MKISPLAILAFVLSWDQASAFVPNTCPVTLSAAVTASHPHTATICFASAFDGASGGSQTRFPYDDDAIRFAYDEWRLIYGKGDFDRYRFENFKTNYKTLTMANIQARDKALKQGQPTPQWMSLNEYGDYSVAEYEAMLQGRLAGEETTKKAPFPVSSPASYQYNNGVNGADELQDQYGRPIRSTQVVQPGGGRGTQVVSGGNAPRGTQVIQSASQQSAFDQSMTYSGYGGEEYQDQFGRTIRPTQVLQSSYPQQQSSWSSGTQVIQQSASPRGTQVISSSGANNGGTRGTQVISKSNDSSFTRGTQVIQSNSGSIGSSFARGTQVVGSSSNGYSSSYGTQVIQSSPTGSSGTQVIRSDSPSVVPPSSYGTQVKIGAENSEGTQVIKQSFSDDASGRGTLVINKDDKETWSKYSNDLPAGEEDDEVSSSVAKRGTMVIKRQIPEPEPESPFPNFFDIFSSKSDKKRETVIIDKTPTKNADEQTKSYGGIFSFFGGSKSGDDTVATTQQQIDKNEKAPEETEKTSIFSLFSGKQTNDDSRPVRGTVILPNAGKTKPKQPDDKRRKTVLIPKKPEEDGLPSILSFFGGAKKVTEEEAARNPNARPTLQIKKPKKQTWSLFPNSDENEGDSPPANFAPNPTQVRNWSIANDVQVELCLRLPLVSFLLCII
jgi:hypothetical protein